MDSHLEAGRRIELGVAACEELAREGAVRSVEAFAASIDSFALITSVLNALPVPVYTTDAAGRISFYNSEAAAVWGCKPKIGVSEWCGFARLFWPDGTPLPQDKSAMATAVKQGRTIKGVEALGERPDGSRVRFLAYPSPLFDGNAVMGAVNMLVEIGDRDGYLEQRLAAIVERSSPRS